MRRSSFFFSSVLLISLLCACQSEKAEHSSTLTNEENQVRKNARVQLWLKEHFEAKTQKEAIPDSLLEQLLEKPKTKKKFHPKIHLLCQVIVVPTQEDTEEKTKASAWRKEAQRLARQSYEMLENFVVDLKQEKDCKLFSSLVAANDIAKRSADFNLRVESGGFDLSLDKRWDEDFIEAVRPVEFPTLLSPFSTTFGEHVVYVLEVKKAHLADGSEPEDKLHQQRIEDLRNTIHPSWQAEQFQKKLESLRNKHIVRFPSRPHTPAEK